MSKIVEALRDTEDGEDVHITKEEMTQLVDILTLVGACIESGRLWFNSPDDKINAESVDFLKKISKRFANIKIEAEQ